MGKALEGKEIKSNISSSIVAEQAKMKSRGRNEISLFL
jgi:hypothetical protein